MPTTRPRRSTSAVSYSEEEASQLRTQLDKLRVVLLADEIGKGLDSAEKGIETAQAIRHSFSENSRQNHLKDAFRNLQGFQILLELLRRTANALQSPKAKGGDLVLLLALVQKLLDVLTASFQDHWGNRKYFRTRAEGGGWESIHKIFNTLLSESPSLRNKEERGRERVFGYLLACAFEDETLNDLFLILGREAKTSNRTGRENRADVERRIVAQTGKQLSLRSPEVLTILLGLWKDSKKNQNSPSDGTTLYTPKLLLIVASSSTHNLLAAHEAGLLSETLPLLLDDTIDGEVLVDLQSLAEELLTLGVTGVADARLLYGKARSNHLIAETLRKALGSVPSPPFIHFDLSLHGYASVELPDLGRNFPPSTSSAGYTLSLWLQVVQFDKDSHTTIFGAFDASQSCFVLVYIEKDTHNLILQTSVTSSRPSVRFKSFAFEPSRWYHVCIVHRRPKTTSSSRAYLFIDGEFMEQAKAHYPASPPLASSPTTADPTAKKSRPVQTFVGTPQDLAPRLGPGAVLSQWRLASACLFNDALSDDLIAIHKELGPRYHGNFQDCLGSFQTYRASAALNIRNENLHPGKEEKSEIIAAIRSRASVLLPENKFLLNVSPMMILDDNDRNNVDESQLIKNLSKNSVKNLRDATRGGRTPIAVNGAIASINSALLHLSGISTLTGDPAIVVPQSLDDASWRIGGCGPIGLSLLDAAQSKEQILRALEILFATVQNSWRNSEAMERENGFGVLAILLNQKLGRPYGIRPPSLTGDTEDDSLTYEVLVLILKFVGYDVEKPEDSVCNNPLAYRMLLVDLDVWRYASTRVQKLYYEQFSTFAIGSKYHIFNSRRLARMRITKKWLDSLKGDPFYTETIEYFVTAFKALLGSPIGAETMRSISLYITYAIHNQVDRSAAPSRAKSLRKSPSHGALLSRRSNTPSPVPGSDIDTQDQPLTRMEVGIRMLQLFADLLCGTDPNNIRKFARAVTSKWLLHLLSDDNARVVVPTTRILARLLVINGSGYVDKFADKTGGFHILKHRLRRWWHLSDMWVLCFAILFGKDVAQLDLKRPFDLFGLMSHFPPADIRVVYPAAFAVLIAMLQNGLKHVVEGNGNLETGLTPGAHSPSPNTEAQGRARSVSLEIEPSMEKESRGPPQLHISAKTIQTVTRFLSDMQSSSQSFKDATSSSTYVQELLFVLFPVVVSSDIISPETELHSRDATLTFNGNDVVIRPMSSASHKAPPIVRTATVERTPSPNRSITKPLKRGSSYVLVTSEESQYHPSPARLEAIGSPKEKPEIAVNISHGLVQEILEMVIAVFGDQIFSRKDFQGIGLFMKVPPGFQEHQAYFESFILRNTISSLNNTIKLDQKLLWETRVLTNMGRFCNHLDEAVYEGWFIDGADVLLDFLGELLEYLQRPDIQKIKSVRLCSEILTSMRGIVSRIALLRLSEYDSTPGEKQTADFINKLAYWQTILFPKEGQKDEFFKLLCYLLYTKLISSEQAVRDAAANLWRIMLVQKPDEAADVLEQVEGAQEGKLSGGLSKILELDNETFLAWVDEHRAELDGIFFGTFITTWENFVVAENRFTEESYKARISKRREKLKLWMREEVTREDVIRRHEISSEQFRSNIYYAEHLKRQRALQDSHDVLVFNESSWAKMVNQLHRPQGLLATDDAQKWKLDLTEGRNRMRLRVVPDQRGHTYQYQTKAAASKAIKPKPTKLALDLRTKALGDEKVISASPTTNTFNSKGLPKPNEPVESVEPAQGEGEFEEDFEIVDEFEPGREDKNRKVMRSLHRGDQVDYVHNISRIVGLEACEGLLIVGKLSLYLIDHFFQRSDGEIVDSWEAPPEERDSYLQMISGKSIGTPTAKPATVNYETRSWRWEDILSISKRRFLFRDVAIEVFFVDGQSYLLTIHTPKLRDELYARLLARAPQAASNSAVSVEDQWRLESLRTPEDAPQTIGSRFTSVFAPGAVNPATRKWMKGEISNFHYLMLVNTMAGRTYNDLTQYPVFPWVLADYTSAELDLTNPRCFRDLSKPMGCQTMERQHEFRERYQSFAEMGDHNAPPFHYGTHYSSAMIVASYLIRLQPFVQSYLLLQGGAFDHPDRLFYSIDKAWKSASKDNMTDVRELIPEFYYLPEMLVNANGYDFGSRQGDGGAIDNIEMPPWANGDPKIFIAKHREALESDYVSAHLHQWIDLVFGQKQRGEAALEATNVFHHLSYRGARNLDEIDDPVERMATIGIIHNFGQTPNQVFQKSHPPRDDSRHRSKKLDSLAETLTKLPFPLLESPDKIASLTYAQKNGHLLCSGGFRINIPPDYDKYLEWGYVDGSVRFFSTNDNKLLGLFEHMHQGQLSAAIFADSRTLITAGTDSTVSVWAVTTSSKVVDLAPKGTLFGHAAPVNVLAAARAFSTLLTASSDGFVALWDLNRLEIVRTLSLDVAIECASVNDVSGTTMLCHDSDVSLYTLNGEKMLTQDVCIVEGDDVVISCAFFEGSGSEYLENELLFTGHRHGAVNVWSIKIRDGKFTLDHVKRMLHTDAGGFALSASITAVLPLAHAVYTGDDDGHVYEWDCIQRQDGR